MSEKVRELREARGISQQGLADLSGLSKAYIGHIETGRRRLNEDTIASIASALNVPGNYLLEGSEDPEIARHVAALRSMTEEQRQKIFEYADLIANARFVSA